MNARWALPTALASLVAAVALDVGASPGAALVTPKRPGPLALGRGGIVYVADTEGHRILALDSGGRFSVVAGTGAPGFSGDGGPAIDARLSRAGGMAVAADGSLVFADEDNNRVREISPDGRIGTIAGNGRFGWTRSGSRATAAPLGSPAAVTISQRGLLYLAAAGSNEILRLDRNGTLTRIAGNRRFAGMYGIGRRAVDASPSGPDGLAFGGGDLYIAGFDTKALLMVDRAGIMRWPGRDDGFYPRGDGGIVTAPNGRVLAMSNDSIVELRPSGERTIVDFDKRKLDGIRHFQPNGIAVGRDGSVYVDTFAGNGWTNRSAIAVVRPNGSIRVLWRSRA